MFIVLISCLYFIVEHGTCEISSSKYSENAQNEHMLAIRAHTVFHF